MHYHFGSREGLVTALLERELLPLWAERLETIAERSATDPDRGPGPEVNDLVAAIVGVVWIVGRVLYMTGYSKAAASRSTGFGIQALATGVLLFGALGKIVWMAIQSGGI